MRDVETIDAELRLMAAIRRSCRLLGLAPPSVHLIDKLLDERRDYRTAAGPCSIRQPSASGGA